ALAIASLVKEIERKPVPYVSFTDSLKSLPPLFRRFLVGVGLFGLGDFAHTLLILLAVTSLKDSMGAAKAGAIAAGLYLFHNLLYASFSMISGYLADRFNKRLLLSFGYSLGVLMTLCVILLPMTLPSLIMVFGIGGIYVAMEETLEDSFCAELVSKENHGMGFGVLATVNGIGDFLSSIIVGFLWTAAGVKVAFAYSTCLFIAGAVVVFTLKESQKT
ncbi:MAG: MFS transporter, partial [Verrucomicrobiae bacterium]|nr:MFS transporter [Verrucomicrobiae bacterium]